MKTSPALKKAKANWESKQEHITFRVPAGKRKKIQVHANKIGESVNKMLNRIVDEELKK